MKLTVLFVIIWISLGLFSCNRLKRKGNEVVEKTKQKVIQERDDALNKVFGTFDSDKPDTKYNKQRFNEFFGFYPTPDVTDLYCYADEFGIDSKYQFSFHCLPETVNRIIKEDSLVKSASVEKDTSNSFQSEFSWWKNKDLAGLTVYGKHSAEITTCLWYDERLNKVYYLTYDL